jgi:hypothetical protein
MPVLRAVVDVLNSLLDAEQDSLFRFMREGSPYLGRASVDVRKVLDYIAQADRRRAGELWRMIEKLGGEPRASRPQPAEQYLAYLSIKFLLPKLVQAKELLLERYRNAAVALRGMKSPADELLKTHLSEHAAEMVMLQEAAEAVARS